MPGRQPNKHRVINTRIRFSAIGVLCATVALGFTDQPDSSPPTEAEQQSSEPSNDTSPSEKIVDTTLRECTITIDSGRKITGIMMESNEDSVVLRINGIDTTYRRARIAKIEFLPPVEERYRKFRASIPDNDIDGRLVLIDWLRDRRAYALAIEELASILEIEPNHPQAKILKTWLEQHLKLIQNRENKPKKAKRVARQVKESALPLLTEEQVNLIRVFELDLSDPPDLKVENSTIRTLMTMMPGAFPVAEEERERILQSSDLDKLRMLFRHKARDLYPEVRVLEDPQSFKDFKKHIAGRTGWLINGCATTRCHGGAEAGDLQLIGQHSNSSEAMYTNFMIIDQYELSDGTPLIDHIDPDRSPLIHMGLVRSRSLYPHPTVDPQKHGRDWRPVFRSTKATNFERTTDWIRSIYTPRPDYGFEYPPVDPLKEDQDAELTDPFSDPASSP
jgi:hypothetical protein